MRILFGRSLYRTQWNLAEALAEVFVYLCIMCFVFLPFRYVDADAMQQNECLPFDCA